MVKGRRSDLSPPYAQCLKSDRNRAPLGENSSQLALSLFGSAPCSVGLSSAVTWRVWLGGMPTGRLVPESCVLRHQWGRQSQKDCMYRKTQNQAQDGSWPVSTALSCPQHEGATHTATRGRCPTLHQHSILKTIHGSHWRLG